VLFMSHLTSPTALRLPVERVVPAARAAGVVTMIDGAHAPGQIPLDLDVLGADLYIGNCHKWLSAPKSAAFLSASARASAWIEPRIVSWGTPGQDCDTFVSEIEYQGTSDICASLTVAEAIRVQEEHDWPSVRARCSAFLLEAEARVGEITGLPSIYTDAATRCPQMVSMLLPERDPMEYKTRLLEEHGVEIPVFRFDGRVMTRASAQAYNTKEDFDALVRGIRSITAGP
jgi:isopenicillin-N epimerase